MEEVLNYLKACGTFYLATNEGGQPRVRPFGAVCGYNGRLYIVTNNQKKVYRQMLDNPKIELCGMYQGTWIRVEAEAVHDSSREARVKMLEDNNTLSGMYSADDGLMEVLYLKNATAAVYSFTAEPQISRF